jgi:hypothetical protein
MSEEPIRMNIILEIDPRIYKQTKRKTLEVLDYEIAAMGPGLRRAVLKERMRLIKESKKEKHDK